MNVRAGVWLGAESLLATALALYLATRLGSSSVWVILPLAILLLERRSLDDYGLEMRLTPPSMAAHLSIALAALTLYSAGHFVFARVFLDRPFAPQLPADLPRIVFHQLFTVALPEEFFFRAYLQTNLNRIFARRRPILGADVGPGLVIQAVVFALCHLVTGDSTRLRVFFFGLLAGWLRDRSGSIAAPTAYHAVANTWVAILSASFP